MQYTHSAYMLTHTLTSRAQDTMHAFPLNINAQANLAPHSLAANLANKRPGTRKLMVTVQTGKHACQLPTTTMAA